MEPADAHAVPTLRDLIQRHIDRTGDSLNHMGDQSGVRSQTLSKWHRGEITEFPEQKTLRLFAIYTAYSEQTVVLAAAATIGLRVAEVGGRLVNSLPPGTDNLSPEDIDAVRAIVRQLVDARRQAAADLQPDMSKVEGLRLADETTDTRTNH